MQQALVGMFRCLPREVLYGVMALIVPFYMLFNRKGYTSQRDFFTKRMGFGPLKSLGYIYLNHFRFGQVVLDRFAAFAGKRFTIEIDGLEHYQMLAESDKGFMQLSSHVGCYELAGYTFKANRKRVNALVFAGESSTVMSNRQRILDQQNMRMVPVSPDLSHLFLLNAALDGGEIVSMHADRTFGSQKGIRCHFFGSEAQFPKGPFAMARAKGVEMLAIMVMKEGIRSYRAYVRPVQNAQEFASALEEIVRRYPAQWFNYYDFWNDTHQQ